jgi:hypothetical protein
VQVKDHVSPSFALRIPMDVILVKSSFFHNYVGFAFPEKWGIQKKLGTGPETEQTHDSGLFVK